MDVPPQSTHRCSTGTRVISIGLPNFALRSAVCQAVNVSHRYSPAILPLTGPYLLHGASYARSGPGTKDCDSTQFWRTPQRRRCHLADCSSFEALYGSPGRGRSRITVYSVWSQLGNKSDSLMRDSSHR
ncbi:hypothetical protein RvY_09929 [Ramazzottius varieornatus]|uniref:Uncharacterized protein n=1 Tax=Ramazzottius varieornatus TaxID=947166 RepID=A0A1D1VB36_RAMVA|nr:hypothetical protein RvY_09929 [Ramazzottius varieornatus]